MRERDYVSTGGIQGRRASGGGSGRTSPLMVMILAVQLGVQQWLIRRLRRD